MTYRIAIYHDYLNQYGGAERVLETLHEMFPQAVIYTLFYDKKQLPQYQTWNIKTSFIQYLPLWKKKYQLYAWLFPVAVKFFNFQNCDLVIISTHAWGNGIRKGSAKLLTYCHTPMRYFWDLYNDYRKHGFVVWWIQWLMPLMKVIVQWYDKKCAQKIDVFIANSHEVQQRIKRHYGREAVVVYPPVNIEYFGSAVPTTHRGQYYVTVSRLKAYKRINLVIDAFNRMQKPLMIIGSGPEEHKLKKIAGPMITFRSFVSDAELKNIYCHAHSYVYMAREDFGITMVEAQAVGLPVIAYGEGGAAEIITDTETGILFFKQSAEALIEAVQRAERIPWNRETIQQNAQQFSVTLFKEKIQKQIEVCLRE